MQVYVCLLLFAFLTNGVQCDNCRPKIAIVGGGIGGASAAYFLEGLFENDLEIDLYEAENLGGRLSTVEIGKNEYESGGSIIHSQNKYMQHFVNLLGLEHRPDSNEKAGIWNGNEFVFEESDWKVISLAKLFYRYGIQPLKLQRYIGSILNDFEKIYNLQDSGKSFENVTALLSAMNNDFPKLLQTPGRNHMLNLGYHEEFIDEVVQSAMVVNYGQDTNIQSFVVCVSLAAVTGDLWAVKGGNKQVPDHLIHRSSNIHIVPSYVNKIVKLSPSVNENSFEIHYVNKDSTNVLTAVYDMIIIATPLTKDHKYPIAFEGFPNNDFTVPGMYHETIATFVKADLNPSYFGLDEKIDSILSCNTNNSIISSVGRLTSVEGLTEDNHQSVWKVFSNAPLKRKRLQEMFLNINEVKEVIWKAYPQYSTNNRNDKFKLDDGLYHVNAIEWAASAMEMSAIGGRNVAILAHEYFSKICELKNGTNFQGGNTNETTPSAEL